MDSKGALRALIALFIAVFFGGAAVVFLFQLITQYQARIDEAKKPESTVMVIVAARDLYPGVTITEDDLVAVEIPPRFLPGGVYLSPTHVVGQRPRERILTNEFIRASRLANPESGEGLNAIIPRNQRAISVEIANGAALSGFLDPGNYVDVLLTITPDAESTNKLPETHTILQSMFVLGVNERTQSSRTTARRTGRPTVTLMVNAQEAETVAHAEQVGELRLSLRNDLDVQSFESKGAGVNTLLGILKKPERRTRKAKTRRKAPVAPKPETAPEPEPDPGSIVTIIRGNSVEEAAVADE